MGSPNPARPRVSLWTRMVDAFHGRDTAAPAPSVAPNSLEWRVDPDTETWWHVPPGGPAGMQEIRASAPDGYEFARLVWQACEVCRLGLIVKIRVTGPWQRHGYGSRMVRFALHGRDGYAWTTTPQSEDARAFFPALTASTGVAFPRQAQRCEHMRARAPRHSQPKRRLDPPSS
ncbi:hypothetical protein DN051_40260 [Streptomyces cadmiisoli]|uniref:Uncharacterized protein n=1 Tax=Streptomyces cadmiisoli TaxID=2184053 RepID=A0A2Z4JAW3_9ACTN|nr:hypothetical protein DN051_00550 [Streptomyces cadmiisoli]AWW42067.1 hypothetical protein DN051_40260 [Streptomyces cadmiisoli]